LNTYFLSFRIFEQVTHALNTEFSLKIFKLVGGSLPASYAYGSTPDLSEGNFCHGLEMKFISPLGWIQQAGASETAAKSATSCFTVLSVSDHKSLGRSLYFISTNFHTELKPQVNVSHNMNSPVFTLYTTMGIERGQKRSFALI